MNTEFQSDTFIPNKFRILSDFQIVLEYISFNKPEVSRKNNRISNDCVIELNKKLSKKLSLDLKQHNQTSYPQINCLFLLLRASGFGVVNLENSRLTLTVDEGLSKQWIKLNETEKYFNLFFTWICNGVPSIIGVEENLIHSFNNLKFLIIAQNYLKNGILLYKIIIKNGFGFNETFTHPEVEDSYFGDPNSGDYTLKSLHIKPGTTMDFTYDFGDNWQFEIMCEAVDKVKKTKPRIIEKKGNSPEQYESP